MNPALGQAGVRELLAVETRFGNLVFTSGRSSETRDADFSAFASWKGRRIPVGMSADMIAVELEALEQVARGDLVVVSMPAGARGMPPSYVVLLADFYDVAVLSTAEFGSLDGTFRISRSGDDVLFDLGYESGRRKSAVYRDGRLTVEFGSSALRGRLSRANCADVLNMAAACRDYGSCSLRNIEDMPMSMVRAFALFEESGAFTSARFVEQCRQICMTRRYDVKSVRSELCGY